MNSQVMYISRPTASNRTAPSYLNRITWTHLEIFFLTGLKCPIIHSKTKRNEYDGLNIVTLFFESGQDFFLKKVVQLFNPQKPNDVGVQTLFFFQIRFFIVLNHSVSEIDHKFDKVYCKQLLCYLDNAIFYFL